MAKLTLPDIGTLANTASARQAINDNFDAIEDALEITLSRDGTTPNSMEADFDMDGHKVLNLDDPVAETDAVNLRSVRPLVNQFASEIAELVLFGTNQVDKFTATAGQVQFTLTGAPSSTRNMHVFLDGVAVTPDTEFTLSDGNIMELVTPATGGESVVVRYTETLPTGVTDSNAVVFTQSGTGATEENVEESLRRVVFVEQFGAAGNGTTNDTDAINAAITAMNAAGGGDVRLRARSYAVDAGLSLKAGVTLRGEGIGATSLVQIGTPTYVVTAQGTLDSSLALTADALVGDITLDMADTSSLAAGDFLILSDNLSYNPEGSDYKSGEMVRVLEVVSATQISLYEQVKGSMATAGTYTTGNTAIVRKINMVESPGLEALTIVGDQATTTGLVNFKYCDSPRVRDVLLRNSGHYGLRLDTARDAVIDGIVVRDLLDDAGNGHVGYGIVLAGANDGVIIANSHFSRCRHAVTTIGGPDGFSRRVLVSACTALNTTQAGFDTHAAGDNITFSNCQVHGSEQQGFSIRSINTEINNCLVSRCVNHGIAATETLVRNMVVRDCTVEYVDQHGFNATEAVEGLIISGNTFRALGQDGIRVSSMSNAVQILDNYITHPGKSGSNRSAIVSIASGANPGRWLVARNYIRADDGSVANGISLPNVNTSYVVDNKLWGTFGTAALTLGSNLDLRNDVMDAPAVTPTALAADANNYAPGGNGSTQTLRVSGTAARAITGLAGGSDARRMKILNVGTFNITLTHESASSTAANRFLGPNSASVVLRPNGWVELYYDGTSSRWRISGA